MTDGEITDVEEIYAEEYHRKAGERGEKQWPAKQDMARVLDEMFDPQNVIDVGCGRGWWLEYWAREWPEVRLCGLDGCAELIKRTGQCDESVRRVIWSCDLRGKGWCKGWGANWDLVLCIEVAEHLEEAEAEPLVAGLIELVNPGGHLFFSAARPRQGGRHHVNLKPKGWWADLFRAHGFDTVPRLRREWLNKLEHTGRFGWNIRHNAMILERADGR